METLKKILLTMLIVLPSILYAGEPVNINTAGKEELMSIKGVGEKRAEAIIAWREQNGLFKSVDELEAVSGIGPSIIDANRDNLTVGQ